MKQYVIVAMIMAAGTSYAQTSALYDCIYRYDVEGKTASGDLSETYNCILQIGEDRSKFSDYSAFRLDSVSSMPGVDDGLVDEYALKVLKTESYFDQTVMSSIPDGKIMVYADMAPERYRYEEKMPLMEWHDAEGTDTVCGYVCRKAVADYGGRRWTAWYAVDIPVPFGPWKITGLPGLVMRAEDADGNHRFEAVMFRSAGCGIAAENKPNVVSISRDGFVERKNWYDRDPFSTIDPQSISVMEVMEGKVKVNGVAVRRHKQGVIPLEYTVGELKKGHKENPPKPEIVSKGGSIKVVGAGSMKK